MSASETCSRCGEEVRWGWRHGRQAYWHREDVDHEPVFGRIMTEADRLEVERQLDLPRTRTVTKTKKVKGETVSWQEEEAYTVRSLDEDRHNKSKSKKVKDREAAMAALRDDDDDEEDEGSDELEPIEVHQTDMPIKGVLRVETPNGPREVPVPGGVRTIVNLAEKQGWEVTRLTYSRGPYLGGSGKSLGVSDSVVLHIRGPVVDGTPVHGVASWRDGKSDTVYRVINNKIERIGAKALTAWMKEAPCG